jgi:hypothetical protein
MALAACQLVCGMAFAQSDAERIKELERKLERSMQLIEQLTRRVNELEKTPPAPVPASPLRAQEARIEALEKDLGQRAAAHDEHSEAGVPVHGFADVGYEHSTWRRDGHRKPGFLLGNLDFFFTPNFGRVKMLAELNFEVESDGDLVIDLERMQLGFTVSDALTAWMGRFHTPYGYWNAAFHHGAQIQTVTRPRFLEFEDRGGILPAHTVGLWATGRVAAGNGKIVYDAYIGNGGRIVDGVLDFNACATTTPTRRAAETLATASAAISMGSSRMMVFARSMAMTVFGRCAASSPSWNQPSSAASRTHTSKRPSGLIGPPRPLATAP